MLRTSHLVIVGGGFSGTLMAINLLRYGSLRVSLVERHPARLAKGVAFGSAQDGHFLNVRASNMSALPDQPAHFTDWLEGRARGSGGSFATRRDYGAYLAGLLDEARRAAGDRFQIFADQAIDLTMADDGCTVALASGESIAADSVVLAPGNLPPHDLPPFQHLAPPRYISEPWSAEIAQGLGADDMVLLLGSGLTAVDCAQTLKSTGFTGRIIALSRRGLLPRVHAAAAPFTPRSERPAGGCIALIRDVRARVEQVGWRNAVDELRPFTQDMWRAARPADRAQFLRHLRPYWDVHRHRVAPQVAAIMEEAQFEAHAGRVEHVADRDGRLHVRWRRRGSDGIEHLTVARIVNCTGPLADLRRTADPLLQALADRGLIRPDALAIGIDVDRQGRAIAQDGRAQDRLMIVGPLTRGAHWEIVAVPDIRRQTWAMARAITGAYWVEAEGL